MKGSSGDFLAINASKMHALSCKRSFSEKLLCIECERKFSQWEGQAKKFLFGEMPLNFSPIKSLKDRVIVNGLPYSPIKLFFMSVLWRFSLSKNPYLKGSSVGPRHEERLRKLLLTENPGEPWRYGCNLTALFIDGSHVPDIIVPPIQLSMYGHETHHLVIAGFLLSFIVASHRPLKGIVDTAMNETGRFVLSRAEVIDIPFLATLFAKTVQIPEIKPIGKK